MSQTASFALTSPRESLNSSVLIDLAADGTITRDDLRAKLENIEGERHILHAQLDAIGNADAERLRLEIMRTTIFDRIEDGFFNYPTQTPQEVHAAYREMDLLVEADGEGEIALSGSFDLSGIGCDTDHRSCALSQKTTNPALRFNARLTDEAPEVEVVLD